MNTLNYIGCKNSLFHTISYICSTLDGFDKMSFLDLFAGTGVVGFNMLNKCESVISNDLEHYSYVINRALLCCNYSDKLEKIIDECNDLDGIPGLIYDHFSLGGECKRMFFTNDNAMKCDAIRIHIETLKDVNVINEDEFYFLLASLLVSIDKVANTSCVYGAYLKKFKKSALKDMLMIPIHTKTDISVNKNNVLNNSAETLSIDVDVLYMDPPYNQRQYSANYSPLNYIALYDDSIELTGKTGLIKGYNKSDFCRKAKAKESFKKIIDNAKCKYILLSYNNEGIIPFDHMKEILCAKGDVTLYKIKYKKFKAQKSVDVKYVYEYLWLCNCGTGSKGYNEIEQELLKL